MIKMEFTDQEFKMLMSAIATKIQVYNDIIGGYMDAYEEEPELYAEYRARIEDINERVGAYNELEKYLITRRRVK